MTRLEAITTIKEAAERRGFTTCKYSMTRLIEIMGSPASRHNSMVSLQYASELRKQDLQKKRLPATIILARIAFLYCACRVSW